MSRSTCSNSNPRVSIWFAASAQNMNASSGSGLCPSRISTRSTLTGSIPRKAQLGLALASQARVERPRRAGRRGLLGGHRKRRPRPGDGGHDEADRLEHVLSEELEARIDRALGFPTHDPHGDPIPNAKLEWPNARERREATNH